MRETASSWSAGGRLGRSVGLVRHVVFFYRHSLRGLLREHQLRLPARAIEVVEPFELADATYRSWHALFGLDEPDPRVPFSYFWPVAVRAFFTALSELELNYRKILHIKEERTVGVGFRVGARYAVRSVVADIIRLPKRRAALLVASDIVDDSGRSAMTLRDWILVKGIPRLSHERLSLDPRFNRESADDLQSLSRVPSRFASSGAPERLGYEVPSDIGFRYGLVSGDLNFIHTFRGLARVFGYPDKFVQGGYTANLLAKAFVHDVGEDLASLTVRFCRPIFAGQTIYLCFDERHFEIVDRKGTVLATGERRRAETKEPAPGAGTHGSPPTGA